MLDDEFEFKEGFIGIIPFYIIVKIRGKNKVLLKNNEGEIVKESNNYDLTYTKDKVQVI
jgi:hypothetical protein